MRDASGCVLIGRVSEVSSRNSRTELRLQAFSPSAEMIGLRDRTASVGAAPERQPLRHRAATVSLGATVALRPRRRDSAAPSIARRPAHLLGVLSAKPSHATRCSRRDPYL